MKVFISWSGELSKEIATLLSTWIPDVIQECKTWISTDDIDKGAFWYSDLSNQLSETSIGILCITKENQISPWVLFEAGALSKGLSKNRVCPLLIDLEVQELVGPLSQLNCSYIKKEEIFKIISMINKYLPEENELSESRLNKAFNNWWDDFENGIQEILAKNKNKPKVVKRNQEDLLNEILEISRSVHKEVKSNSAKIASKDAKATVSIKHSFESDKVLGANSLLELDKWIQDNKIDSVQEIRDMIISLTNKGQLQALDKIIKGTTFLGKEILNYSFDKGVIGSEIRKSTFEKIKNDLLLLSSAKLFEIITKDIYSYYEDYVLEVKLSNIAIEFENLVNAYKRTSLLL